MGAFYRRDAIDGRYPFADSPQEVSAEDFLTGIFASVRTDAFEQQLACWRTPPAIQESTNRPEGNMTLQGAGFNAVSAGEADPQRVLTARAGKIFRSMQISVVDMDPAITELVIDIDGQVLRYAHGPTGP